MLRRKAAPLGPISAMAQKRQRTGTDSQRRRRSSAAANPEPEPAPAESADDSAPAAAAREPAAASADAAAPAAAMAGGQLTLASPLFSGDGRFFFVCCYATVRVYSTSSAELLTELEHGGTVTGVAINPLNAFQLLTASVDGRIRVWEYQEGKELRTVDLGLPIVAAVLAGDAAEPALVLSCAANFVERAGQVSADRVKLVWYDIGTRTKTRSLYKGPVSAGPGAGVVVNHDSSCIAWVAGGQLFVLRVGVLPLLGSKKRKKGEPKPVPPAPRVINHPRTLTTVAFHPTESTIATGDEEGAIVLSYLSPEFVQGTDAAGS